MLTTLTIGVVVSVAAELVTWVNKKLSGTVLQGKGAFLLAAFCAVIGAGVKVVYFDHTPITDYQALGLAFAQVWTVAQGFFVIIVETLGFDVQSNSSQG